MSTVDKRIVEMEFDNQQFEKGVSVSMKTLDALSKKLEMADGTQGLKSIARAAESLSLRGISDGVETLNKRFSAFGVAGMTIIKNLTEAGIQMGKNLWNNTFGQMQSGGKSRALNLQKSKFLLEGMGISWKEVEGSIRDSVDGTAYAMDKAAMSAASLSASGVQLGEDMDYALGAISGLAAITGDDYDHVAEIFKSMASLGKVTAQDLNRIQGVNMKQVLADVITGGNVEDITKLISKGAVDFQTFADIVYDKYFELAKGANTLTSGAVDNLKSALNKIGELFQIGWQEYIVRDGANALRLFLNELRNGGLGEAATWWNNTLQIISKGLTEISKYLVDYKIFSGYTQTFKNVMQIAFYIAKALDSVLRSMFGKDTLKGVYNFGQYLSLVTGEIVKFLRSAEGFNKLKSIIEKVFKTLEILYKNIIVPIGKVLGGIAYVIFNIIKYLASLIVYLYHITPPLDEIKQSIIDIYNQVINSKFMTLLTKGFQNLWEGAKALGKGIADLAVQFWNLSSVQRVVKFFEDTFIRVKDKVIEIGGLIKDYFWKKLEDFSNADFKPKWIEGIDLTSFDTAFNGLLDKLVEIKDKVVNKAMEIKKAMEDFFNSDNFVTFIIGKVKEWKDKLSEIDWEDVWSKIKEEAGKVRDVLNEFKDAFVDAYNNLNKELSKELDNDAFDRFKQITGDTVEVPPSLLVQGGLLAGLAGVIVKVVKTIKTIIDGLGKAAENIDSLTKSLTGFLDEMSKTLKTFQDRIKPNKLSTIAKSLLILTISVAILAVLPWKALAKGIGAIGALGVELYILTKALSKIKPEDFKELAKNLIILSAGILILAVSCRILATLELDQLGVGLLGILALMGIVILFTIAMGELQKKLGEVHFGKMMGQFVALAVVVGMLASVVFLLGHMSSGDFSQGLLGVLAIMASLLGFVVVLKYLDKQLGSGQLPGLGGLIAVAAAIMIISVAVGILGRMKPDTFAQGLLGVMALLAAFIAMGALVSQNAGQILKMGFGLLVMAAAITLLVIPIKQLGAMDLAEMGQGLAAILAFIVVIALATKLLNGSSSGSTALLKMAAAMAIMAVSIALLGVLIYPAIAGIAALTATLLIFIVAGYLLSPVATILLMVGGAVMMFGAGILLAGTGVLAFAEGIMTLVLAFKILGSMSKAAVDRASYAIAALVVVLANGVQVLIKSVVQGTVEGIALFLKVLADAAPGIAESLVVLGTYLIGTLAALVPAFMDLIGLLITSLIVTINYYTVPITQSILAMILAILWLLQDYTEPITTAFLNILYNFLVAIINFIPELVTLSVEGILIYIQALTAAIDIYGPMFILAVKNLFYACGKVILDLFDEVYGDIPVIGEEIKKATAAERDKITKEIEDNNAQMQAAHDAAQETMDAYVTEMTDKKHNEDALKGITEINSTFTTQSIKTQETMKGIGWGTGEGYVDSAKEAMKHGANGMPSTIAETIGKPAEEAKGDAETKGKGIGDAVTGGIFGSFTDPANLSQLTQGTDLLGNSITDGLEKNLDINSPSKETEKIGNFAVDGLANGLEKNKGKVSRAAATLAETGLNKMRGYKGEWSTVGDYANAGYASGLTKNLSRITSAVNSISQTALRKLKDFLGIHSPSKETEKIGRFFDMGLAVGIEKNANLLGESTKDLGKEALDVIGDTMLRINEALSNGIEFSPTITPVLNLDNLYSGMNSIDTAFSRKTAVMANLEMDEWKTRQNSNSLMNDTLNKISRINSDNTVKTVNAINDLSDKMDRLQVVLDSGELVGGVAEKMDNALGNRSVYSARANM